jgi:hypothetical protein
MDNLESNWENRISKLYGKKLCEIILHIILFRTCFSSKHPLHSHRQHSFKSEEPIVTPDTLINLGVAIPM